jgi:FdhD protein
MGRVTTRCRAQHLTSESAIARPETLVVEEPMEIRVNGSPITVTMRTPGSDIELAQGFLLTEGIITRRDDVLAVRYCRGSAGSDGANTYNVLDVTLAADVPPPDVDITRNFYTTSSCGVCGKASIDAVRLVSRYSTTDQTLNIAASTLTMPESLRSARTSSRPQGDCTVLRYSIWTARCSWCGRTSAVTTPSTR